MEFSPGLIGLLILQTVVRFFRFKHMQMRVNAESAAFFRAAENELRRTNGKLTELIQVQKLLVLFEYPLNCKFDKTSAKFTSVAVARMATPTVPLLSLQLQCPWQTTSAVS